MATFRISINLLLRKPYCKCRLNDSNRHRKLKRIQARANSYIQTAAFAFLPLKGIVLQKICLTIDDSSARTRSPIPYKRLRASIPAPRVSSTSTHTHTHRNFCALKFYARFSNQRIANFGVASRLTKKFPRV